MGAWQWWTGRHTLHQKLSVEMWQQRKPRRCRIGCKGARLITVSQKLIAKFTKKLSLWINKSYNCDLLGKGGCVFSNVCLLVCFCLSVYSKVYERIAMKFCGRVQSSNWTSDWWQYGSSLVSNWAKISRPYNAFNDAYCQATTNLIDWDWGLTNQTFINPGLLLVTLTSLQGVGNAHLVYKSILMQQFSISHALPCNKLLQT